MKIKVSTIFDISGLYPVGTFKDDKGVEHEFYMAHDAITDKKISISKDVYDKLVYLTKSENRTKENIADLENNIVVKFDKVKLNLSNTTLDGFISL